MAALIVAGGYPLEIRCPSAAVRETQSRVSFIDTLGGKRKAFLRRGGRRTWDVDLATARRSDVATVEAVARYGGPVGWYGPEAMAGNLLSPQASGFDDPLFNATDVGLVSLPGSGLARAVALSGAVSIGSAHGSFEAVPVRVGTPVTVAGWGLGGLRFSGVWRDADLASVGTLSGATNSFSGWGFRSQTFNPPAGAVALSVSFWGASQVARPSVAWGSTARDELGTGCPVAVAHDPRHAPISLTGTAHYTASSFTVTEVG